MRGTGAYINLPDVPYTTIPLHYKGGSIVAQRSQSANTTTELRKQNFSLVIAPSLNGTATGSLYLDDGDSLYQTAISYIQFSYANGTLSMTGTFDYDAGVSIETVTVLGSGSNSTSTSTGVSMNLTGPQHNVKV